jgi:polysaccharide export outer membrane protein
MTRHLVAVVLSGSLVLGFALGSEAQTQQKQPTPNQPPAQGSGNLPQLPKGYVIGPEDVLSVVVWREKELSTDVVVRSDGKISIPLLNDVQAAGLTPEQLAQVIEKAATKFVTDSDTTVIVKEIHSRKVYVIGEVAKPGVFPLNSDMTVLQLIAAVGGLLEYADKSNIMILRTENGKENRYRFNYKDVLEGRNMQQNVLLQPGDTVLVR